MILTLQRNVYLLIHFHPFIQQIVDAYNVPDTAVGTQNTLRIKQVLGPHGACSWGLHIIEILKYVYDTSTDPSSEAKCDIV